MKVKHSFLNSVNCAIEGIITAVKIERNMKIHVVATIVVILGAFFLRLDVKDFIYLSFAVSLVWITELLNSSIEKAVDLTIGTKFHDLAKKAKDIAAGAVFVAAVNSVVIGYLIFGEHLKSKGQSLFHIVRGSYSHMTVFILILVCIIVIALKTFFYKEHKGTPIQGGMPSGHSALAFSVFGIVLEITDNVALRFLVLFLAILVGQSRVKNKIHTISEVFFGALVGFGVSYFIMYALTK